MRNYSQCKVYKLQANAGVYDDESNDSYEEQPFYIGSTCKPLLCQRMTWHRSDAKKPGSTSNVYQWMRDIGIENVEITLLQAYPECTSFDEQRKFEREWVDKLRPSLNTLRPYVTREELREYNRNYYQKNKDGIAEYQRNWREKNRASIAQYKSERHEKNRDSIVEYRRAYYQENRERLVQEKRDYRRHNPEVVSKACQKYCQRNKEKIAERDAAYRRKNKEAVKMRKREYYLKNRDVLIAKARERYALKKAEADLQASQDAP